MENDVWKMITDNRDPQSLLSTVLPETIFFEITFFCQTDGRAIGQILRRRREGPLQARH